MSLRIVKILAFIRQAAPYLAIELILPGGSLVALTLWMVRNRASLRRRLQGGARFTAQLTAARG
jgi:hypothetical protein